MNILVEGQALTGLRLLSVGKNMVVAEDDTNEYLIKKSTINVLAFNKEDLDGLSFDDVYRHFEPAGKPIANRISPAVKRALYSARSIYSHYGAKIPGANEISMVAALLKAAGSVENLTGDLEELGRRGHLSKGRAYQMAVINSRAKERGVQLAAPFADPEQDEDLNMDAGKSLAKDTEMDGVVLPNGDIWSAKLGRRVSPREWREMVAD